MADDDILDISDPPVRPDGSEPPKESHPLRFSRAFGTVLLSAGFTVVVGLIIGAFQIAGVISMGLAHLLIFLAWVIAAFAVWLWLLSSPRRHTTKIALCTAILLGIVMFGVDRLMVWKKGEQEQAMAQQQIKASPMPTLSPSPLQMKSLHDYFNEDFMSGGTNMGFRYGDTAKVALPDGKIIDIEVYYHIDAFTKASFLSFYIPNTRESFDACVALAKSYKAGLTLNRGIDAQTGLPGERQMELRERDVKFTGRVFIYHEFPLFNSDIDKLTPIFKANGADVQFRGTDWALARGVNELKTASPTPSEMQ